VTKCESWKPILGSMLVTLGVIVAPVALAVTAPPPLCPYPGQTTGLNCLLATPAAPLLPATQPKYVNELPQPVFFTPDQSDGVFDYYEIFSGEAGLGLAAPLTPFSATSLSPAVSSPAGTPDTWGLPLPAAVNKVWLGLVNPLTPTQKLLTEVWGYGQQNMAGGPLGGAATYPAMSFRATKGKPVKVMWINKNPNAHMLCKFPLNASYPCGIDRTLMGTKFGAGVTAFGGTQQPDNAMVVHLHGGEIPPDSDGFAELWFGNAATAAAYRAPVATVGQVQNIDPALNLVNAPVNGVLAASVPPPWNGNSTPTGDTSKTGVQSPFAPVLGSLIRPTGDSMIYNYPMVQEAATIWYHDHALGKTRVNVIAGPAGYFYVQDPLVDTALWGATSDAATGYAWGDCTNGGILAGSCRDVPIVLQDRAFNADGSINFPNGLGQVTKNKFNPLTPGPNPSVHPQWVPEYFGDVAVVNGITWPKLTVGQQAYRFRLLDGSNARCYTLSLAVAAAGKKAAAVAAPTMTIIGSDQGYLPTPRVATLLTMCPGERYEVVVDFSAVAPGTIVDLVNTAGAPFPAGPAPQTPNGPYAFLASMMQFNVVAKGAPAGFVQPANWATAVQASVTGKIAALAAVPAPPVGPFVGVVPPTNPNTYILNEVADPLTKAPLRVQIDGKAFEDAVDTTPKRGSVQYWDIVNTTVDAHPMHLHLVQFKVIGRWTLDINKYTKAAITPNPLTGGIIVNKAINPMQFVMGAMRAPEPGEEGFKDTAKSFPGELLRIVAKWDGGWQDVADPLAPAKPFYQPVTSGPYVWHCHIVDHEDNEMMRPTLVIP
jgi:spore coat protein A, manganese oxidase